MKEQNYKWILYSITLVILGTIGIQVYWNYKNYEANKQEYINDIQSILDESIEHYYANLAKEKSLFKTTLNDSTTTRNPFGIFNQALDSVEIHMLNLTKDSHSITNSNFLFNAIDSLKQKMNFLDTLSLDSKKIIVVKDDNDRGPIPDSINKYFTDLDNNNGYIDITIEDNFKVLTSQIVISLTNDSLNLNDISSILEQKLKEKSITLDYKLLYNNKKEVIEINNSNNKIYPLQISSQSVYLAKDTKVELWFTDVKYAILKRIYLGVLISAILILSVIYCLFYLLKVIQKQKQVGEIKNDFISNITHEFKTPIATISVALESIRNFNASNHPERSETYLDMSKEQLDKLNLMVEKLLETATLDKNNIELYKEQVDIVEMITRLVNNHQLNTSVKTIEFNPNNKSQPVFADAFHIENVINNLIDNAVKYGGNSIKVNMRILGGLMEIYIKDSGTSLSKKDAEHLFEKFYRQPTGNQHDVKGFGIGLYYSKKIIEQHKGKLTLSFDSEFTIFKISMPYE